MKKVFFTSAVALLTLFVTANLMSCSTTQYNRKAEEAVSRDVIGIGIVQIPTVADLEINPKRESYNYEITVAAVKELEKKKKHMKRVTAFNFSFKAAAATKHLDAEIDKEVHSTIEKVKTIAKSKMLIYFNADVLIDPRYSVEVENNEKFIVTVSGYLGTYKNFRNMTLQDTALVKCPVFSIDPKRSSGEIEVDR
jgi:hypothetical protein